jgi:FkbM family methyltransferase
MHDALAQAPRITIISADDISSSTGHGGCRPWHSITIAERMHLVNRAVAAISRRLGRPELFAAINSRARREQYEAIGVRAVIAGALESDGTYIDIGTNRGQLLREAVRIAPRGHHIAFEPIPALAADLARAFPDVDCRQLALGAHRQSTAEFCYFHELDGWSGLLRNPQISDERGRPEYITVGVSTLDEELKGVTPRVVKIDVEGAELAVLEGARQTLGRARPVVIFERVLEASRLHGATPAGPWDLLSELGYQIFSVTGEGPFTRTQVSETTEILDWLAKPGPATD